MTRLTAAVVLLALASTLPVSARLRAPPASCTPAACAIASLCVMVPSNARWTIAWNEAGGKIRWWLDDKTPSGEGTEDGSVAVLSHSIRICGGQSPPDVGIDVTKPSMNGFSK